MNSNLAACLAFVLAQEGGYVDNPNDPGGATNLGITQATLAHWRGHKVTPNDVKALQPAEAGNIYEADYWRPAWCDKLPGGIDLAVFDTAVNMGPGTAVAMLKHVVASTPVFEDRAATGHPVGMPHGGWTESKLLDDLGLVPIPEVIDSYCRRRVAYYAGLIAKNPNLGRFQTGWDARVARVKAHAKALWVATPRVG